MRLPRLTICLLLILLGASRPEPARADAVNAGWTGAGPLTGAGGGEVIAGVPAYGWTRGCSPTAAAMLLAAWASRYPTLWDGPPAPTNNPADDNDSVNAVIEHLGDLMGTTYSGSTNRNAIPKALVAYAQERQCSFRSGNRVRSFDDVEAQINAGSPVHLGIRYGWNLGHSVLAYGYRNNPGTDNDWIAVMDTWQDGNSDGRGGIIAEMADGVEWWKWSTDRKSQYNVTRGASFGPLTDTGAAHAKRNRLGKAQVEATPPPWADWSGPDGLMPTPVFLDSSPSSPGIESPIIPEPAGAGLFIAGAALCYTTLRKRSSG